MRRVLRVLGIGLVVLIGVILIVAAGVYAISETKAYQKYPVADIAVNVPHGDPTAIARGEHLVQHIAVCVTCHGENMGGGYVVDDPMIGTVLAPNLTTGKNGFGNQLSDEDIARVLRTAVLPDGKSAWVMPSEDYTYLAQSDLEAVIAYIRSLPPVDSELGPTRFGPLGRILTVVGALPINSAETTIPKTDQPVEPPFGVTVEYGNYLANISGCTGCHGQGLSGGIIPGTPPDFPPATNITTAGAINGWTEDQFINTIRTGTDPSGHVINEVMPWKQYANMTDDELKAIWAFLQSMPPKEYGNR